MSGKQRRKSSKRTASEARENKQWAREYILDPLTAPEPSQECGPGSSFIQPSRRSLEQSISDAYPLEHDSLNNIQQRHLSSRSKGKRSSQPNLSARPSPPPPTRFSFEDITSPCSESRYPNEPAQRPLFLSRSNSTASSVAPRERNTENHTARKHSPPPLTRQSKSFGKYPPSASVARSQSVNPLPVPPSATLPKDTSAAPTPLATPRTSLSRSNSATAPVEPITGRPRRRSSLLQRFPGDMSNRPLDMLRRESQVADKAPHLRAPSVASDKPELGSRNPFADPNHSGSKRSSKRSSKKVLTDTIDRLDHTTFGGTYHHDGPYDAVLASRNTNAKYAPMEAVRDSNLAALRATPRDRVIDSLTRHVPLQGTAEMPPGVPHPRTGETLDYEEGADLMRDANAGGGPYKRWPGLEYLDEDLKGKGEPSYTIERRLKESKRVKKDRSYPPQVNGGNGGGNGSAYEMQPTRRQSSGDFHRTGGSRRSSSSRKEDVVPVGDMRRRRGNNVAASTSTTTTTSDRNRDRRRPRNGSGRESGDRSSSSRSTTATTERRDRRDRSFDRGGSGGGSNGNSNSSNGFGEALKRRFGSLRWKE